MNTPATPHTPTTPFSVPKRAHGRRLGDFGTLFPAEQILLAECERGQVARIGNVVPTDGTDRNKIVRASFLRFLLLGGDEQAPVHEKGVQLFGAWIQGELDLRNCLVPYGMKLEKCKFDESIIARDAHIAGPLFLSGSHLRQGLRADRLKCDSSVFLRDDFRSAAKVRLAGAHIGGSLSCAGGQFEPGEKEDHALSADRAVINGGVFLVRPFKATGTVRFIGAEIGDNFVCSGGLFEPKEGVALSVESAVVKGGVFLDKEFKATGTVRLLGAQIGDNLTCNGGDFFAPSGDQLSFENSTIKGRLFLRNLIQPARINATSAQVGVMVDDPAAWAKDSNLSGLVYKSISGSAPTDAARRIAWLKQQSDYALGVDKKKQGFRPQPWKQLQKVLREMGHEADARLVSIEFENQLLVADRIEQITDANKTKNVIPFIRRHFLRCLHRLLGTLAGYGYRPLRLFMSMVAIWLLFAAVYWHLALPPYSAIGPTDPLVFQNRDYRACTDASKGNWFLCNSLPAEYTTFSPLAYSLDILLPLVDLGQEKSWGPLVPTPKQPMYGEFFSISAAHFVRLLNWIEILYGWVASLLFVAIVSGMSRRSEMDK